MTKYREILRLKHLGFSERNIARNAGVSRNTVKRVAQAASANNIDWKTAEQMDDATIENRLLVTQSPNLQKPIGKPGISKNETVDMFSNKEDLRNFIRKR